MQRHSSRYEHIFLPGERERERERDRAARDVVIKARTGSLHLLPTTNAQKSTPTPTDVLLLHDRLKGSRHPLKK